MKPYKCKVCGTEYVKKAQFQKWCGFECASVLAEQALAKKKAKEAAQDRRQTREKLKAMEKYPSLVKKAQAAFNGFIRARDSGKPCISCGRALSTEPNSHDAGHFRSVGSAPHMRFVEENCHSQCRHCNHHLGGNHVNYRMRLVNLIGVERVEQIESDNTIRKYTREGLEELAKQYREMTRKLKNENQA